MEDGEIIFRAKMPGGAVESRVFPNIRAFQDEMIEEGKRWQGLPALGSHDEWNPQASFRTFLNIVQGKQNSSQDITAAIDEYYSPSNTTSVNTCFYPSWTLLLRNSNT